MEYDGHGRSIIALRIGRDAGKKGMAVVINTNTGFRGGWASAIGEILFSLSKKKKKQKKAAAQMMRAVEVYC